MWSELILYGPCQEIFNPRLKVDECIKLDKYVSQLFEAQDKSETQNWFKVYIIWGTGVHIWAATTKALSDFVTL